MQTSREESCQLLDQLIADQERKLLACARQFVPRITPDDLLQPNDFPALELNPYFRHEEGILDGLRIAATALRESGKKRKAPVFTEA